MPLGRFFGVKVRANWLFLALLAFGAATGYLIQIAVILGTLFTHELAHLIVARGFELPIDEIELLPFGGVARFDDPIEADPHVETTVAVAGPLNNFFLLGLALLARGATFLDRGLLDLFTDANLVMATFNLLPALPLDGGRIFRAYLARKTGYRRATERLARVGRIIALVIALGGVAWLFFGRIYASSFILAVFLYLSAAREERSASFWTIRQLLRKKDELARRGVLPAEQLVVGESTPLGKILPHFVARRYHFFTVTDPEFRATGTLTESDIVEALFGEGPEVTVGEVLRRSRKA
ncbi:MAG: site-2 protease family protein [Actinobacteria bacterium]|nr:site-2 protease family protein [Actinomycetota bacterium]